VRDIHPIYSFIQETTGSLLIKTMFMQVKIKISELLTLAIVTGTSSYMQPFLRRCKAKVYELIPKSFSAVWNQRITIPQIQTYWDHTQDICLCSIFFSFGKKIDIESWDIFIENNIV